MTARSETTHFPDSIDFDVTVSDSSAAITSATIFNSYYPHGASSGSTNVHHDVPIAHPGRIITLHDSEDTSGSGFVLPGTPIDYYWQFQDSAGNTFTDAVQHFTLVDSRFSWRHLSRGLRQVNWYDRPQDFGQVLLTKATFNLAHIDKVLGNGPTQPIYLWMYETSEDFRGALGPVEYEWVGGEAFPGLNQAFFVIMGASDYTLVRDMPHEMTHLVFGQLELHAPDIPAWFNEGLAVYNQFYHEPEMTARLQKALDSHTLLPLSEIEGSFPADADQAYLAYAQSWNLVGYMYRTFGQAKMAELIRALNNPLVDFEQAVQQVLGMDLAHLENQWHLSLHQLPTLSKGQPTQVNRPTVAVGSSSSLLITIGVVLLFIVLVGFLLLIVRTNHLRQRTLAKSRSSSSKQD